MLLESPWAASQFMGGQEVYLLEDIDDEIRAWNSGALQLLRRGASEKESQRNLRPSYHGAMEDSVPECFEKQKDGQSSNDSKTSGRMRSELGLVIRSSRLTLVKTDFACTESRSQVLMSTQVHKN